jgi:hypothetical protein
MSKLTTREGLRNADLLVHLLRGKTSRVLHFDHTHLYEEAVAKGQALKRFSRA